MRDIRTTQTTPDDEGGGVRAEPGDDTHDHPGDAETRDDRPLLVGELGGEVERDAGLEELERVGREGRQRTPVNGVRVLSPVLRGPGAGLRAGVGHEGHHVAVAPPYVGVLVPELLGDNAEFGDFVYGRHAAGDLNGLSGRHLTQHLAHILVTHRPPRH
ncbi:hypothetical protein ACWGN9_12060 [Streptomyces sp. NPDC055775]